MENTIFSSKTVQKSQYCQNIPKIKTEKNFAILTTKQGKLIGSKYMK